MTIKDLKSGQPFKFNDVKYMLEEIREGQWIVSKPGIFGGYIASIETMGTKRITCFTYVLGKRVDVVINIDNCSEVTE
jgi:hypothetical protein